MSCDSKIFRIIYQPLINVNQSMSYLNLAVDSHDGRVLQQSRPVLLALFTLQGLQLGTEVGAVHP